MSEAQATSRCSESRCDGAHDKFRMLQALLLRDQLAAAKAQAQAATAETATLQQLLDSERAAAAGERQQLEAEKQQLETNRQRCKAYQRLLEAEWKAPRVAIAEQCAAVEAAQRQAEADAKAARTELSSFKAQVPGMWLSAF